MKRKVMSIISAISWCSCWQHPFVDLQIDNLWMTWTESSKTEFGLSLHYVSTVDKIRQLLSSVLYLVSASIAAVSGRIRSAAQFFFITPIHAVWKDSGIDLEWIKRKQEAEKGLQYLTSLKKQKEKNTNITVTVIWYLVSSSHFLIFSNEQKFNLTFVVTLS